LAASLSVSIGRALPAAAQVDQRRRFGDVRRRFIGGGWAPA